MAWELELICIAYFCTMTGRFLGICVHLCTTLIPIPLAEAGYILGKLKMFP